MNRVRIILILLLACGCALDAGLPLTFDEAVQRTLYGSPRLRISNSVIGEQGGLAAQSRLLPNPVFSYSVENVLGIKNWEGWEAAESRYEVAQLIELGGKRAYRSKAAGYELYAAEAGFEAKKLATLNNLLKAFIDVAGLQEQFKLAQDQLKVAEEVFKTVAAKVEAGRVSLIQQNKAEITLATAKIALERTLKDFDKAKEKLATFWGDPCPDFNFVIFPLHVLQAPKPLQACVNDLMDNPELIQSQYEYLGAYQNWKLEKAGAIPDLTLTVGYKTLKETGDKGMILGASLPITIFNQNQGNIQKAYYETQKTMDAYHDLKVLLENKLSASHRELEQAYFEAERFSSSVLKTAQQSFDFAQEGYQEGKFEYLDMLDSQRTLFEVRENYINALIKYHKSQADIEYLNTQ